MKYRNFLPIITVFLFFLLNISCERGEEIDVDIVPVALLGEYKGESITTTNYITILADSVGNIIGSQLDYDTLTVMDTITLSSTANEIMIEGANILLHEIFMKDAKREGNLLTWDKKDFNNNYPNYLIEYKITIDSEAKSLMLEKIYTSSASPEGNRYTFQGYQ